LDSLAQPGSGLLTHSSGLLTHSSGWGGNSLGPMTEMESAHVKIPTSNSLFDMPPTNTSHGISHETKDVVQPNYDKTELMSIDAET
jgi:hypothetical protein